MELARSLRPLARRLIRTPSFTLICAGTLGLGIGAVTATYAVVDGVLLEPLPYPEPDRLVGVWHTVPGLGFETLNQSPALHMTYVAESRVFDEVGVWDNRRHTITGIGEPEQVEGMGVTEQTLRILGARPLMGRLFSAEEDRPGSPLTALVGWGYWQSRLDADPGVIGRTLTIDGQPHEVIGVLPREFRVLSFEAAVYTPFRFDPSEAFVGNFSYQGLARLRPGATIDQANADVARMLPIAMERYPGPFTLEMLQEARFGPNVRPLSVDVIGDVGDVLWVLLGTVGIVLLIACANVANLFLVRAESRYREVAVRAALGASRGRIAREFLGEAAAIAAVGGLLGVGLAAAGVRLLQGLGPEGVPRLHEVAIDGSVLLAAVAISGFAALLLGLVPILRHRGAELGAALREGGRGGSAGRERHRARSALVVSQLALALVLLAGSGLMIRSAAALRNVEPGFQDPEEVLTMRLTIPFAEVEDVEAVAAMHEQILRALEQVPGATSVGMSSSITMDRWDSNDPITVEDFPLPEGQIPPVRRFKWISPGYFETMGNRIVAGRAYTWSDMNTRVPVVIVTENFAREYWGSAQAAIGRRIRVAAERPWREIIGVAGNVHDDGVDQEATSVIYWPTIMDGLYEEGTTTQRSMGYVLRLSGPATPALMDAVRRAVWSINPNLPLADVRTLDRILAQSMARTSFTLIMLAIAAAVALTLGAVGLYGVISYAVAQRTREFGVRMALGARRGDVGRLVLRHAGVLVAIGLGVGLVASVALTRLMTAVLFGVEPVDPVTLVSVAAVLAFVALVASLVPVARATRVDPLEALRWE